MLTFCAFTRVQKRRKIFVFFVSLKQLFQGRQDQSSQRILQMNKSPQFIKYGQLLLQQMQETKQEQSPAIQIKNLKLVKKLGEGAFGQIYLAVNTKNGAELAVKLESIQSKNPQLCAESKTLLMLADPQGKDIGLPNVYFCSTHDKHNIMVMDLLGPSLQELFNICNKKFTIGSGVGVGLQILKLIRYIHSKGILHRDIKPDNFLIGRKKKSNRVYLIDFGLAKKYIKDGNHIPYRDNKNLTGTARYASINTHLGVEQGRRDDIQSLMYVIIYFLKGSLPWQSMKAVNKKQKHQRITERKLSISLQVLCGGLPKEITQCLLYVRSLHFQQQPNYDYLQSQMQTILDRQSFNVNGSYDWGRLTISNSTQRLQCSSD